jgi:hypothetical protein
MADTTHFAWTKPTVSGDLGAWGTILNTALDDVDDDLNDVKTTADAALPKASGTFTGTLTGPTIVGTATTDSTTSTSGAIKTAGGIAAAKAICAGTGFGCNGKAPQTAYTATTAVVFNGPGSFGFSSTAQLQDACNLLLAIRTALIANGIMV